MSRGKGLNAKSETSLCKTGGLDEMREAFQQWWDTTIWRGEEPSPQVWFAWKAGYEKAQHRATRAAMKAGDL